MFNLLGEYHAKLDPKGRAMMPKALLNQLKGAEKQGFVVNRDVFQKCLVIYPQPVWENISKEVNALNRFIKKNADFIRKFNNGATPIEIDNIGRINIPKVLAGYAATAKDIVFLGNGDRIELWDKQSYEAIMSEEVDFGALSEEVMGGMSNQNIQS